MTETELRDLAWIGDAVLALYTRQWLLEADPDPRHSRQDRFVFFTSNQFLSTIGEPTRVEAHIGQLFQQEGLPAAFAYIRESLQPAFLRQLRNRDRRAGG